MRDANLTAYFTPHEANPDYVGPWPDGCYYSPVPVTIGEETIYVDEQFQAALPNLEGFGKIHRLRYSDLDGFQGGQVPPVDRQYIGYIGGVWGFYDKPYNAQTPGYELTLYSTARNSGGPRSYYNNNTNYTVRDLNLYGSTYVQTHTNGPSVPANPPDGRITDDSGSGNPEWMDIYFDETDELFGVDPEVVNTMSGSTWRSYLGNDVQYPDTPIKVYK